MIFVLIPLFLVADLPVEHGDTGLQGKWQHGPEMTFVGNFAYTIDAHLTQEPVDYFNVTCILKCRPKSVEKLLCRVDNVTQTSNDPQSKEILEVIGTEYVIKFNETGVENLGFDGPQDIMRANLIRTFASLLSVGADLTAHANTLEDFTASEHIVMGHCNSHFSVKKYEKSAKTSKEESLNKFNLTLWTPPKEGYGSNILIVKTTEYKRCAAPETKSLDPTAQTGKAVTKLYISDTFRGEYNVQYKVSKGEGPRNSVLRGISTVELTSIEPAIGPLNRTRFFDEASLAFWEPVHANFVL